MNLSEYFYVAIDPVAFSIGPLSVHWYGIMYLLAFLLFWTGGRWLAQRRSWYGWKPEEVGDFLFYGMVGVIIGGRIGYVLFYGFSTFLNDPVYLFRINEGGMSFHGGLMGVIVAMWLYGRKTGYGFWGVSDFVAPLVPIGLGLGRLGNFVGGELWGRLSDAPWAMIFANAIQPGGWQSESLRQSWMAGELDSLARHPSQLYQAGMEGFLLAALLLVYASRPRKPARISGLFLVGYGAFRFIAEYFREPDAHIGFVAGQWLTMGMLLSLPMIAAGLIIMNLPASVVGDARK